MINIEKISIGLKCLKGEIVRCNTCPYSDKDGFGWYGCKKSCADDALTLLKEQLEIVKCKDCKHGEPGECGDGVDCDGVWHDCDWFCADGVKRE